MQIIKIARRGVTKNVAYLPPMTFLNGTALSTNYHAVVDYVDLLTECHVIAAAMQHLGMTTVDERPKILPRGVEIFTSERKKQFLLKMVGDIVDRFIYHSFSREIGIIQDGQRCGINEKSSELPDMNQDHIFNYASGFMTHGLMRKVSLMTTAVGDGDRALRNWKYALLNYHQVNKFKYRLEAFLLLASVTSILPPRLAEQVKWGRFVNLSGGPTSNLDGDEVMEILNNWAKSRIKTLGTQ